MTPADYRSAVARAYDAAPLLHLPDVPAWEALARETLCAARAIESWLTVSPTNNPEPYATARDMFAAIDRRHMLVSDVHHDHPTWTPEINRAFRIVHDVMGHWSTGADFSWEGELRAYEAHARIVEGVHASAALFTEAVGQVAWAINHGGFGPQKVATLPQWLQWADVQQGVAA